MELRALGLDPWFDDKVTECDAALAVARVTAVDRDRYLICGAGGERPAELSGRLRYAATSPIDFPCVGDWVCASARAGESIAIIHRVLPRKSSLRRKVAGKDVDFQMIAANVDVALLVQSCHFDFNLRRLERYLVMAREGGIEPVLLLTKTDLVDERELARLMDTVRLAGSGARVVALSNLSGLGLDQLRESLHAGRTYCLLGSSGVGKTTLINRLAGGANLGTRDVSRSGEGRHTTTRRQLLVLEGGALLIDTPGMRELGLLGVGESIEEAFVDVATLARDCRYTDCRHLDEPGCAVRAAVDRHELSAARLQSYLKLGRESAFHELSHAGRRKKDRDFGRLVRSTLKDGGKRGGH
jgi:ribosome biogenesis GTPase / thiamine phosphate phosphatase